MLDDFNYLKIGIMEIMWSLKKTGLYIIELLITAIILFSIIIVTSGDYKIPDSTGYFDADEALMMIHEYEIESDIYKAIGVSFLFVTIFEIGYLWIIPAKPRPACLIEKYSYNAASVSLGGVRKIPSYALLFEFDDGSTKVFGVDALTYSLYFEGNKGILKYNERVFTRWISFFIEDI